MGLFTPIKKHANEFRYIPRYYDPEKERREQRRRELNGTSSEQEGQEYQPGQYIRTQREARRLAQAERMRHSRKMPSVMVLAMLALLVMAAFILYPRLVDAFSKASTQTQSEIEVEEFNPYTPITIVPNDYKEE